MNSKKIYLIRHGETEYNRKGIVQGSGVDASLNEKGQEQAKAFFEHYEHVTFGRIYTSVLRRSIESVQGFIRKGIPHTALKALNEIHWGDKEGKAFSIDDYRYYHEVTSTWREGNTHIPVAGGESPDEVSVRLAIALKEIISDPASETILICMHGRAMRILLCLMMGCELRDMDDFEHANLGLYEIDYRAGVFTLLRSNDVGHLNGLS